MTDRLRHRRILVTGALGAFGSAVMRELRHRGAEVAGIDLNAGEDVIACDITDPAAVTDAVTEAVTRLGGLDALINCAGIGVPVDAGEAAGPAARKVVEVNLWGQWNVTAAAIPHLVTSRGRVVFVASALARVNAPFAGAYAVSKRALTGYADALRIEYGSHVAVSTVYPGYVDTPIHAASDAAGVSVSAFASPERVQDVVDTIVGCLAVARPPRDIGTTGVGRWQLWAARRWPALVDRVVLRRVHRSVMRGDYGDAPLTHGMLRRHRLAAAIPPSPAGPAAAEAVTVTTSDGVTLRATAYGPADAPVCVVYLHGWCLSSRIWRHQPDAMARLGNRARLITVDLRGHGESECGRSGSMTIDRLADDLKDVLDALCPGTPAVVVGHSMGGMTIMALAERHGQLLGGRVVGAVLVNTAAVGMQGAGLGLPQPIARGIKKFVSAEFPRRHRSHLRRGNGVVRKRATDTAFARYILFGPDVSREDLRLGRELIATTHPAALDEYYRDLIRHDREAVLPTLDKIPVEILGATRDRLTPLGLSRRMSEAMPGARLTILPGSGHTIPLERAEELADRVDGLVRQVTPE